MGRLVGLLGHYLVLAVDGVGRFTLLVAQVLSHWSAAFRSRGRVAEQMQFVGVTSLPLIVLTSVFVGAVTTWQTAYQIKNYVPMRYLGTAVGRAIMIELAPVLSALVVAGRVGAGMAAEIGSMKVTEQVDALECMAIDPIRFLVVPRVVAGLIMLPILVVFADLVAIGGAMAVSVLFLKVPQETFVSGFKLFFKISDVTAGLSKAAVFGLIITLVGCDQGLGARGGALGVGRATTRAVVVASVSILIADYLIAVLMFRQ
jgi:phospholipid/cholesterol/gamma-HCH transport system permease protein